MKFLVKLVFVLSLLTSYQSSFACSDYEDYPLLEKKTSGGYVPSDMAGWERGIRVLQSGKIIGFSKKKS